MKNWLKKYPKIHRVFQRFYYQFVKRHIFAISGPLRSLPDFIIIGTARSGTTSLYYNICQHPCVFPAAYDELGFFDSNFHLGLNWYRSLFPTLFSKWIVKHNKKFAITGEDTPFYIWSPTVAKRILKILPNVKLIVLFRNPIDRAYSNYHLGVRAGSENLSFEDAIQVELNRLTNKIESENELEKYTTPRSYIAKGLYANQLKIWLELFNNEQLFIISTEDFESKPQETLDKIFDFLQIPKNHVVNPEKHKVASYPKMKSETRKFLVDFYKKPNAELFSMIGREFDWDK
ncbi:MAG: sulfotransferase domain-containing protein [Nitrosopumilus sp.]|uniref:sulfotransferase family protein n=1 Tax=Nitrosopumilus sp. TaxID=2024843 RepID=UPI00242E4531|nr:sulfotransferase [Nitrosopumilus sp.]MCV0366633.1 sulfotransferase domain-containing protein [Nitrosopumilus sp.]